MINNDKMNDFFNETPDPIAQDIYERIRRSLEGQNLQFLHLPDKWRAFPPLENHWSVANRFPPFLKNRSAMAVASASFLKEQGIAQNLTRVKAIGANAMALPVPLAHQMMADYEDIVRLNAERILHMHGRVSRVLNFDPDMDKAYLATHGWALHLKRVGTTNISQMHANFVENHNDEIFQHLLAVIDTTYELCSRVDATLEIRPLHALGNNDQRPIQALSPLRGIPDPTAYHSVSNGIAAQMINRFSQVHRAKVFKLPGDAHENHKHYWSWAQTAIHGKIELGSGIRMIYAPAFMAPNLAIAEGTDAVPIYALRLDAHSIFDSVLIMSNISAFDIEHGINATYSLVQATCVPHEPNRRYAIRLMAQGLSIICQLMTLYCAAGKYGRGNYKPMWTSNPSNMYACIDALLAAKLFIHESRELF